MHLMNRKPAVEAYYGKLAQVIERPMTPTVAEYPDNAKEVYGYDPAKAAEYFSAAGYTKDSNGKLVKNNEKLVVSVGIGEWQDGSSFCTDLSQMANDMAALGAELVIQDLDFSTLVNKRMAENWICR